MTESKKSLAKRIRLAAEEEGISASTFCRKHFSNSSLVARLEEEKGLEIDTYNMIIEKIGEKA